MLPSHAGNGPFILNEDAERRQAYCTGHEDSDSDFDKHLRFLILINLYLKGSRIAFLSRWLVMCAVCALSTTEAKFFSIFTVALGSS